MKETTSSTWRQFFRKHGKGFLRWLQREQCKVRAFDRLARGIEEVVVEVVRTPEDARRLVQAFSNVYGGNCPTADFNDSSNAMAYLIAHMLERYSRTWDSLVELTRACVLPLSKSMMRALDVGSGPGPGAYAIWDFYSALQRFLGQNPRFLVAAGDLEVHCCERGRAMVDLMNTLSELSKQPLYHAQFGDFRHVAEAIEARKYTREEDEPEYWSENEGLPEFYRLVLMGYFLTRDEMVSDLEVALRSVFGAIRPGGVVVMMSGSEAMNERLGLRVAELAKAQGLIAMDEVAHTVLRNYDDYCGWRTKSVFIAVSSWLSHLGVTESDWKSAHINKQIWSRQANYGGSESFSLWAFRKGRWPTARAGSVVVEAQGDAAQQGNGA